MIYLIPGILCKHDTFVIIYFVLNFGSGIKDIVLQYSFNNLTRTYQF